MNLTAEEMDETARLVLMDMAKHEGFLVFSRKMRDEIPNMPALELQHYYQKYRGFDRIQPTHDLGTGLPLSRR